MPGKHQITKDKHTRIVVDSHLTNNNHKNIVIDPEIEHTENSTGLTQGEHCEDCNKIIIAQNIIPKKQHILKNSSSNVKNKNMVIYIIY